MKFGLLQRLFFKAGKGAYSIVTADERHNSQITITDRDGESEILVSIIGEKNIPRSAAKGSKTRVNLWTPEGSDGVIELTINFPKATGSELRIYRNARDGFAYNAGDVWFVFSRGRKLFVGSMPENQWRSIGRLDDADEAYTASIYEPEQLAADPRLTKTLRYPRDRAKALAAFKRAHYKCEVEPGIPLFIAGRTGRPYLEPHHLVPLSMQKEFRLSLDHTDNIYALSPHHHRRIHLGTPPDGREVIHRLLDRRKRVLTRFGVTDDEVIGFYNLEIIR
jgi:5-methylcytosine-specific restriction protein A